MAPTALNKEQLSSKIQGFDPTMPLERPPRTLLTKQDFNALIHDPESLVSKTYWGAHKFHFFVEVLEEYHATLGTVQQQQLEEAIRLAWELKNEREPIGGPIIDPNQVLDGDPLQRTTGASSTLDEVDDEGSDLSDWNKQQQQQMAMAQRELEDAIEAAQQDFMNDVSSGDLFALDEDSAKAVAAIYGHQGSISDILGKDKLETFNRVQENLLKIFHDPEFKMAMKAGHLVVNYIQKDVIPALAAASVLSKKEQDVTSEDFKQKFKGGVPRWQQQAEKLDAQRQKAEDKLSNMVKATKEFDKPKPKSPRLR